MGRSGQDPSSIAAGRPPLLGRDEEWNRLSRSLTTVQQGRSQFVFIEGEAGIGKTRLVQELHATGLDSGFYVFVGRAEELELMRPFGAIVDGIVKFSREHDPLGKPLETLLRGGGGAAGSSLFQLIDGFVEFVEELALSRPACIVLDDLHWADTATISAARVLARRVGYLPILFVGTYRPHPQPPELSRLVDGSVQEGGLHIHLQPLDDVSLVGLAAQIVGADVGPGLTRMLAATSGNPLYASELVQALTDEGAIRFHDGSADAEITQLPPTLRLTILRRLSLFSADTLRVLQVAAVLGSTFRLEEVAEVVGKPVAVTGEMLTGPLEAKLIEERDGTLAFRHDLIREALYEDIPSPLRASMHVDSARGLRRLAVDPVRVAEHLMRGLQLDLPELFDESVALAQELVFTSPRVFLALCEKALRTPGVSEERRDFVRVGMVFPLVLVGRTEDAERLADEILRRPQDPTVEALVLVSVMEGKLKSGRFTECVPVLERIAADLRIDESFRRLVRGALGGAYVRMGDASGAEATGAELVAESRAAGDDLGLVGGFTLLAMANVSQGHVAEAVRLAQQGVDIDLRNRTPNAGPLVLSAVSLLAADRLDDARDVCRQGRRRDAEAGVVTALVPHGAVESLCCFLGGRWDDAIALARTTIDVVDEGMSSVDGLMAANVSLAQILLRQGAVQEAMKHMGEADRFVAERGPQLGMDLLAWTKALSLQASGEAREALNAFVVGWDQTGSARHFLSRPAFPDLVRLALAAGDRGRAEEVTKDAEEAGKRAPEVPSAVGVALQCRGLLDDDPDALLGAVDAYRKSPRVVERAIACENAGRALIRRGKSGDARPLFEEAIAILEDLGAVHDVSRLMATMRDAGIRRGSRAPRRRPTVGWEALTPAELQVAELTIEGLTNPRIAERLFVSKYTVQTHLSHIFAKLGISSRVELAALASNTQR